MTIARKTEKLCYIPDVEKVGVYMIENVDTRKRYIGSTVNLKTRLTNYESALRCGYSINRKIDEDVNAGYNRFFFTILATFEDGEVTNKELSDIERDFLIKFGGYEGYNYQQATDRGRLPSDMPLSATGNVEKANEWRRESNEKSRRTHKL